MSVLRIKPLALSCLLGLCTLAGARAASADAFVDQLVVADAAEIQAAQAALAKTTFEDTRTFAQRMIDNHTDLNAQLIALATQLNITVPDAATIKAKAAKLQPPATTRMGPSFDAVYATAQVNAHEGALGLFTSEAQSGATAQLRAFALNNLPMIKHHLLMAQRLLKTHRK